MKKKQDWPSRLNNYLLKSMDRPFRYGRHDCCIAVAKCLKAMTGESVIKIIGEYNNEKEAKDMLKKFKDIYGVAEYIAESYNLEKISKSYATGGDVIIVRMDKGEDSLGILGLDGRSVYVAKRPCGWGIVSIDKATRAYRI